MLLGGCSAIYEANGLFLVFPSMFISVSNQRLEC